jgi:hypothetical protein
MKKRRKIRTSRGDAIRHGLPVEPHVKWRQVEKLKVERVEVREATGREKAIADLKARGLLRSDYVED